MSQYFDNDKKIKSNKRIKIVFLVVIPLFQLEQGDILHLYHVASVKRVAVGEE